ncbi:MAG: hypothetical protein JO036_03025 [Candidatus Eremiobacteraeota bacterium]|nr:hypothetical protein [Candidatus Eremiobacteraeota bacterium]
MRGALRWVLAGALSLALLPALASHALAGPPFLTDDPAPIDFKHSERYIFGTTDRNAGGHSGTGPAIEFNTGALPNVHIHFVVPYASSSPLGGPFANGIGDAEFGIKYRFVQETNGRPQIGIFPMAELATGDAAKGLGNGRTWYRLPIWIQKSYGKWTTYGGGGTAINKAPGMANYGFAGWLVQRDFSDKLTLGTEVFYNGPTTLGGRHSTYVNTGGYLKPNDNFNVLFSIGHTISGESHAIGYFALYWTWGPKAGEVPKISAAPETKPAQPATRP